LIFHPENDELSAYLHPINKQQLFYVSREPSRPVVYSDFNESTDTGGEVERARTEANDNVEVPGAPAGARLDKPPQRDEFNEIVSVQSSCIP
jgi:hypothetical protein